MLCHHSLLDALIQSVSIGSPNHQENTPKNILASFRCVFLYKKWNGKQKMQDKHIYITVFPLFYFFFFRQIFDIVTLVVAVRRVNPMGLY